MITYSTVSNARNAALLLSRACDIDARDEAPLTLDDLLRAGTALGVSREAVLQAFAWENADRLASHWLLGVPTVFRAEWASSNEISAADLQKWLGDEWNRVHLAQTESYSMLLRRVGRNGCTEVAIVKGESEQRVIVAATFDRRVGLVQFLAPLAGAFIAALCMQAFNPTADTPAVLVFGALIGFAGTRMLWRRIAEHWHSNIASLAAAVAELTTNTDSVDPAFGRTALALTESADT